MVSAQGQSSAETILNAYPENKLNEPEIKVTEIRTELNCQVDSDRNS